MVYMDFEALMKNSLPLWVYCVCTNCGDGVRQECPLPDRLLQDVVMENKKIRFGGKLETVKERSIGQGCLCRRWGPFNQTKLSCWQWQQCEFKVFVLHICPLQWLMCITRFCPWLSKMKACGTPESHLALTYHHPWFAISFSNSQHDPQPSWRCITVRSEWEITRY